MRALFRYDEFAVRAVTRDPTSPKAHAREELGCEVVSAHYNEPDSLHAAMEGAYGAWFITSFWDSGEGTVKAAVQVRVDRCLEDEENV